MLWRIEVTNSEFARLDREFRKMCSKVVIKTVYSEEEKRMVPVTFSPTARQASKWRNQKGRVWKETRLLEN